MPRIATSLDDFDERGLVGQPWKGWLRHPAATGAEGDLRCEKKPLHRRRKTALSNLTVTILGTGELRRVQRVGSEGIKAHAKISVMVRDTGADARSHIF